MAKKENRVSPLGEAKWAHVHEPKAPFEGQGDSKYMIDIVFEKGGEWDDLGKEVAKEVKDNGYANMPIKPENTKEGEPTGRFFITFKTGEQYPPKVFDKFGQIMSSDILVGNGSTVRVSYTKDTYKGFGGGVIFYFNAVQVVDLVEYKGGSAEDFGFPVEESDNPFPDSLQDPPKTGDNEYLVDGNDLKEDDIPF